MKRVIIVAILVSACALSNAQSNITGTFPNLSSRQVKLSGFSGFDTYIIDSVLINDKGEFSLTYGENDYGMGILTAADNNRPLVMVLSGEAISIQGESLSLSESIEISEGRENKLFVQYSSEYPRREQSLNAWDYLERIYTLDTLFAVYDAPIQAIAKEKNRIKAEDRLFLADIAPDNYISYYLPLRKLVSSVSTVAQYRAEEIPSTIEAFRKIDYTDARLHKSGLLSNAIESHFWLIENSGHSLDSVYIEMKVSINKMIETLIPDEQKLNEITAHLFKFLEQRSLFPASEYLAIKLLNETSCTLTDDFASQMESYRAMKKGNIAPDIYFDGIETYAPGYSAENTPRSLSELESQYKVVIFGASWCPQCPVELQNIRQNYAKWNSYGVEVVFVALEEDSIMFKNFTSPFPFISICDYLKWESPVVEDWHVFATPTIYLLKSNREIILKPNSVSQLDSWIDWYLVKGNK